jgi:hypothetical protein
VPDGLGAVGVDVVDISSREVSVVSGIIVGEGVNVGVSVGMVVGVSVGMGEAVNWASRVRTKSL